MSASTSSAERRVPPALDVDSLPAQYALMVAGNKLAPIYPEGTCLVFDKVEPWGNDDFVVLHLKQDKGHRPPMVFKVVAGNSKHCDLTAEWHPDSTAIPTLVVEQLTPQKAFSIDLQHLLGIHKVIRTQELPR